MPTYLVEGLHILRCWQYYLLKLQRVEPNGVIIAAGNALIAAAAITIT